MWLGGDVSVDVRSYWSIWAIVASICRGVGTISWSTLCSAHNSTTTPKVIASLTTFMLPTPVHAWLLAVAMT
eukprot:2410699-Amphidinium_carterae.2